MFQPTFIRQFIAPKSLIWEYRRTQIFPGISLQYFIKWKHRQRSNTSNSRTYGHSTQVINIHKKIQGHRFPLGIPCNILLNRSMNDNQILQTTELTVVAPKLLIFMTWYKDIDLPWDFLAILHIILIVFSQSRLVPVFRICSNWSLEFPKVLS